MHYTSKADILNFTVIFAIKEFTVTRHNKNVCNLNQVDLCRARSKQLFKLYIHTAGQWKNVTSSKFHSSRPSSFKQKQRNTSLTSSLSKIFTRLIGLLPHAKRFNLNFWFTGEELCNQTYLFIYLFFMSYWPEYLLITC